MLPPYTALFKAHQWLSHVRGFRYSERELHDAQIAIARARLLAVTLAAGNEDHEPAALLLALLMEANALGPARDAFPTTAVRHCLTARRLDLVLDFAGRLELREIRDRVAAHPHELRLLFAEVRAFLADRLRPLR
jgi:hypothetical protein